MRFFLLRDSFTTFLACPLSQVVQNLSAQIEPRRWIRLSFKKGYEGEVSPHGFTIKCIGRSKNDFRPLVVVRGSFQAIDKGTHVTVVLHHRFHWICINLVLLLLAVLGILGALLFLLGNALDFIADVHSVDFKPLFGCLILVLFWAVVNFSAWGEVRRVQKEVAELLESCPGQTGEFAGAQKTS